MNKLDNITASLKKGISNSFYCGTNIRYTETYLSISSKFASQNSSLLNDMKYEQLLTDLLFIYENQTKDIQILCWIMECCAALFSCEGLYLCISHLYDLITTHWDEFHPLISEKFDISFRTVSIEWVNSYLTKKLSIILKINNISFDDIQKLINQDNLEEIYDQFHNKEQLLLDKKVSLENSTTILYELQDFFINNQNVHITCEKIISKLRMFYEVLCTITDILQNDNISIENNNDILHSDVIQKTEKEYQSEILNLSKELLIIDPNNILAKSIIEIDKAQNLSLSDFVSSSKIEKELVEFIKYIVNKDI